MKINFMSDLHFEFSEIMPQEADANLKGGDVLVLAGDIIPIKKLQRAKYFAPFLAKAIERYHTVIAIAGNHEYYGAGLEDVKELREYYDSYHVKFLDNESHVVDLGDGSDPVKFFGATLWTDMNNDDPVTKLTVANYMNDFHVIRGLTTDEAVRRHRETMKIMRQSAPRVVVTHMAPSSESIPPRFRGEGLANHGYYSNIDIPPSAQFWIHGHVHQEVYYEKQGCWVVANPRGYPHEAGWTGFDFGATVEV